MPLIATFSYCATDSHRLLTTVSMST